MKENVRGCFFLNTVYSDIDFLVKFPDNDYKKAQLMLSNPRDVKACKNCSNSTCFVSFHRIPFPRISKF